MVKGLSDDMVPEVKWGLGRVKNSSRRVKYPWRNILFDAIIAKIIIVGMVTIWAVLWSVML